MNTLFHSRWTNRSRVPLFHKQRLVLLYLAVLILSSSYAPEPNPGPQNHEPSEATGNHFSWLCGTCDCTVGWGTKGVACNNCGQWFHAHCQSIDTRCYENLEELGEQVPWFCAVCESPNSKTVRPSQPGTQLRVLSARATRRRTDPYTALPLPEPASKINGREDHWDSSTSTATLLWGEGGGGAEISNLIYNTKPDVIVATETWLDPSIKNNRILPDNYEVFRIDRNYFGGGVLIAV